MTSSNCSATLIRAGTIAKDTLPAQNIWSVTKRHARKLFGGRILTRQLDSLCREWVARANQPELFASPITFLQFTMAVPG